MPNKVKSVPQASVEGENQLHSCTLTSTFTQNMECTNMCVHKVAHTHMHTHTAINESLWDCIQTWSDDHIVCLGSHPWRHGEAILFKHKVTDCMFFPEHRVLGGSRLVKTDSFKFFLLSCKLIFLNYTVSRWLSVLGCGGWALQHDFLLWECSQFCPDHW